MMRWALSAVTAAFLLGGFAAAEETPARPVGQRPPAYPATCMPADGGEMPPATVTVRYDISREGAPVNVRAAESTNACFDETAVAAIRSWRFEPRRVDGKAVSQTDAETTFTFVFEQTTDVENFDARPLVRVPPRYPDRCQRKAQPLKS